MANIIRDYFSSYEKTKTGFERFHNEVINMPRPSFSEIPSIIKTLKSLASYIMIIDKDIISKPIGIKQIYNLIYNNFKAGIVPTNNRNIAFENRYLNRKEAFEYLYSDAGKCGRMFRHYMAFFTFLGYFDVVSKNERKIDLEGMEELLLAPEDALFDVLRNRLLEVNINSNPFIKVETCIPISKEADYRPARAILNYCNSLNRPATDFEIAILLGRVDSVQKEKDILLRAIKIGSTLPSSFDDQRKHFFGCLGWKNSAGELFQYSSSQNPDFKFKSFIILMDAFGLINYDYMSRNSGHTIVLTEYSKQLIKEDLPIEVLDLQELLSKIDDDSEDSNKLQDIILKKRTDTITKAIQADGELVIKFNKRNIRNPIIKDGKRKRNRIIAELAKIKANYKDEVTGKATFMGLNGNDYVEAHHIIEFSTEQGPDITDNLLCLGPDSHSRIHHGAPSVVDDLYRTLQNNGVLNLERYKHMCTEYRCLTKKHVNILYAKKLISSYDKEELLSLIEKNGVDPVFLNSLSIPTENY